MCKNKEKEGRLIDFEIGGFVEWNVDNNMNTISELK